MKSTGFWIAAFAALLLASVAASLLVLRGWAGGTVANIYQNGERIHSIDLSKVEAPYTLRISGAATNTVAVEPGRICVLDATCPDRVCVHQGWISEGVVPIVCLPNGLVIRIENAPDGAIDAVTG